MLVFVGVFRAAPICRLIRSTNSLAISSSFCADVQVARNLKRSRLDDFLGKMHEFEDKRILLGFQRRQVLAGLDDDFGDADFAVLFQCFAKQRVGFGSFFLGSR